MSPDGARRFHRLRQTEVEHLHRAVFANLDVRGFQVAMDDPLLVCGFERVGNLLGNGERFVDRQRPRAMRSASVGPSTSSITSAVVPPDFSSP